MNWLNVFNSAITFGILAAIALGVWLLVIKKDTKSRTLKRR